MPPAPPTAFNPYVTVAPYISFGAVSAFLFGVSTVQTYLFYRNFPKDRLMVKLLVALLWILEFAHALFVTVAIFELNVKHFGDPFSYQKLSTWFIVALVLSVIIYTVVLLLLTHRVRIVSGKRWMHLLCWAATGSRDLLLLVSVTMYILNPTIIDFTPKYYPLVSVTLSMFCLTDILICGLLTYSLWRKRHAGLPSSINIVDKLILWTAQSGVLTTVLTLSMMLCYIITPYETTWIGLACVIPRVYTNTLLASLNGRLRLNEISQQNAKELPEIPGLSSPMMTHNAGFPPITIEMTTSVTVVHDGESESERDITFVTSPNDDVKNSGISVEQLELQ